MSSLNSAHRKVRIGLIGLMASLALTSFIAGPAAAAGNTSLNDVRGCFTWATPGTLPVAYAGQPVFLEWWDSAHRTWKTSRSGNTASNGCIQFNDVQAGYYWTLVGYKSYFATLGYYFYGASAFVGPSNRSDTLLRTGYTQLSKYYY